MDKEKALHIGIVESILHGNEGRVSCRTCYASQSATFYSASDDIFIDSEHYQGVKKASSLFNNFMNNEINFDKADSFCSDCVENVTKAFIFQTKCHKIETLRIKFLELLLEYADSAKLQAHTLPSDATEMYVYIGEPDYPLKEYDISCFPNLKKNINAQSIVIKKDPETDEDKNNSPHIKCEYCGVNFNSKRPFITHLKECLEGDGNAIKEYLNRVFPKEDVAKPTLVCFICCNNFSCKQSLIAHLRIKCLKDDPAAFKQYVMKYFPKTERTHDFQCPLCKKSYSLRHSLYLHLKDKCMRKKDSKTVLKYLKSIYRAPAKTKGNAKCLVCGNFYATRRSLLAHLKRNCMKGKPKDDIKEFFDKHYPYQKSNMIYVCPFCGKSTSTEAGLSDHTTICLAKRNPEIPRETFPCSLCDSVFFLNSGLKKHIDRCHGTQKFSCAECGKTFKAKMYLRNHLIVHTRERNYSCDICHNKFINQRAVIIHRRIHTGEKPYPCSECNEKFISQSRRSVHMKRKHLEPMFRCELCFKSFVAGYPLRKHLRTHKKTKLSDLAKSHSNTNIKISDIEIKYEIEETVQSEQ